MKCIDKAKMDSICDYPTFQAVYKKYVDHCSYCNRILQEEEERLKQSQGDSTTPMVEKSPLSEDQRKQLMKLSPKLFVMAARALGQEQGWNACQNILYALQKRGISPLETLEKIAWKTFWEILPAYPSKRDERAQGPHRLSPHWKKEAQQILFLGKAPTSLAPSRPVPLPQEVPSTVPEPQGEWANTITKGLLDIWKKLGLRVSWESPGGAVLSEYTDAPKLAVIMADDSGEKTSTPVVEIRAFGQPEMVMYLRLSHHPSGGEDQIDLLLEGREGRVLLGKANPKELPLQSGKCSFPASELRLPLIVQTQDGEELLFEGEGGGEVSYTPLG